MFPHALHSRSLFHFSWPARVPERPPTALAASGHPAHPRARPPPPYTATSRVTRALRGVGTRAPGHVLIAGSSAPYPGLRQPAAAAYGRRHKNLPVIPAWRLTPTPPARVTWLRPATRAAGDAGEGGRPRPRRLSEVPCRRLDDGAPLGRRQHLWVCCPVGCPQASHAPAICGA
jgi:hypothetical protein